MPGPVAKGLIVTVSALVAAGVAVYESPQFRQWVENSRRRLALALYNLGDEIHPRNATSPVLQDISMTEDTGPAATERRRIAREELARRRSLLEEHRKRGDSASTFDALVDDEVELGSSQAFQRGGKNTGSSTPMQERQPAGATVSDREGMRIDTSTPGNYHTTLFEYTPTSEVPDTILDQEGTGIRTPSHPSSPSTHSETFSPILRAEPGPSNSSTNQGWRSPFSDLAELADTQDRPSTPSTTASTGGSYSQIYQSALDDGSSDGTLSDLGQTTGGIATPASWSEVGSVVSQEDLSQAHL